MIKENLLLCPDCLLLLIIQSHLMGVMAYTVNYNKFVLGLNPVYNQSNAIIFNIPATVLWYLVCVYT